MNKVLIVLLIPVLVIVGFIGGRLSTVIDKDKVILERDIEIHQLSEEVQNLKKQSFSIMKGQEGVDQGANQKAMIYWDGSETQSTSLSRAFIDKNLNNLPKVLREARAVPYIGPESNGDVSGFKLVSIKPGSVYEKIGLQSGDIIKGVDGRAIDTPQDAMNLYQSLKKSDNVKIQIIRAGKKNNLNIQFEK